MSRKPTKSFFDSDNSAKAKGPYYRKTSRNTPPVPTKGSSALPVSSKSKKELEAFRFAKPETPKKNPQPVQDAPAKVMSDESGDSQQDSAHDQSGVDPEKLPLPVKTRSTFTDPHKEPPHTPAPRVPLSQLLSFDDDKAIAGSSQPNVSPEERLYWQSGTPSDAAKNESGTQGSTKRGTESLDTPAGKRHRDVPFDLQGLDSTLETPMVDPASQLWKKYYGSDTDPNRRAGDPAAQLFRTAARSPSGFRRAHTSPAGRPNNRLKRRKTTAFEDLCQDDGDEEGVDGDNSGTVPREAGTRKAGISRLMNEVKKSMDRSALKSTIPDSSSPLRDHGRAPIPSSPLRRPATIAQQRLREVDTPSMNLLSSEGDEYGDFDDDISMDIFEEVDRVASTARSQVASMSCVPSSPPALIQDDDEFGDDDDLFGADIESIVAQYDAPIGSNIVHGSGPSENQAASGSSHPERTRKIQRYEIVDTAIGTYQKGVGRTEAQTMIRVREETHAGLYRVLLRGSWQRCTNATVGQTINLVGNFDKHGTCIVDDSHNYIVLNPDVLVSATTVADTLSCMRKAVLQERVRASGDISKPMVYGNILHALFQSALEANDFSTATLDVHIDRILKENLQSLYLLREDFSTAKDYVKSKLTLLQDWKRRFVSGTPNPGATVEDHRSPATPLVAINKLLDIEEHVWSPLYGLKGNIDATVQAIMVDNNSKQTLTLPLELKTGKQSTAIPHRAQTMLYTLLISDRYDIHVKSGLLYYMEVDKTIRVSAIRNELRELVIKRNEVASFMLNRHTLPEMLQDSHACSRCYAKSACFIYHKALEDGSPESSGAENAFSELTQHLKKPHQEFFKHWDTLLTKEEKDSVRFRREIWTMTSSAREALGRCFGGLTIIPGSISVDTNSPKINKYTYSFKKNSQSEFSFFDSQLSEGDPIVVSDEQGHIALAIGFITSIQRRRITVQVDRRLHNARSRQRGFNENSRQVFNGIFEIDETTVHYSQKVLHEDVVYRVDKDEYGSGMASVRNNLIQLMSKESSDKYRRLIIELQEPIFKDASTAYNLVESSQAGLNEDQRRAVEKVMTAQDYALVLGMPGTGKTTTIAHIIRALVSQGKSVLLTSYTHTAVDNILVKLKHEKFGILRLGSRAKILPEVTEFAQLAEIQHNTFDEIRDAFNNPKVVATTCLGINHPIFTERLFDYCIVDEASQITLPVCVGPIRLANTFVLVGDHYQLPPLVKNPEAREGGLDVSLFKLLCEAHPGSLVSLEHQYRMCEEIMALSNKLIYSGRLKCGTLAVAKRALKLPHREGLQNLHGAGSNCLETCWTGDLLAEKVKAVFVNTDSVPAIEEKKGDRINNPIEADLVFQMVESLLSCGVDASQIGVISVYRSQLKIIQHLLRGRPAIEMHTADRFQGRDKEIVIISLVRSNDQNNIGELLRDWRRINVAFTRARSKLIIIGSRSTLCSNELLRDFVNLMECNNWIYTLPANAHLMHHCVGIPSATVDSTAPKLSPPKMTQHKSPKRIHGLNRIVNRQEFWDGRPVLRDLMKELS